MTWLLWIGLVMCLLAITAAGLPALGSKRWAGCMADLARGLEAARRDRTVKPLCPTDRAVLGRALSVYDDIAKHLAAALRRRGRHALPRAVRPPTDWIHGLP